MLSIVTVKSDDDTHFAEEMRVTFADIDPFTPQMCALSLTVGPETGATPKNVTTTVTHWPCANMTGISTSLTQRTLGASTCKS